MTEKQETEEHFDEADAKDFGRACKIIRQLLGLGFTEVYEKSDVSKSALFNLEAGKRVPSMATQMRLAKYYGCRVANFWILAEKLAEKGERGILEEVVKYG